MPIGDWSEEKQVIEGAIAQVEGTSSKSMDVRYICTALHAIVAALDKIDTALPGTHGPPEEPPGQEIRPAKAKAEHKTTHKKTSERK